MSVQATIRRKTAPDIRARKGGEPVVRSRAFPGPKHVHEMKKS